MIFMTLQADWNFDYQCINPFHVKDSFCFFLIKAVDPEATFSHKNPTD